MKPAYLLPALTATNCIVISWCYPAEEFANDIQKLLSKYDMEYIGCGKHIYVFNLLPNNPHTVPFSFPETNSLMQLIQGESDYFYIKAAIREYIIKFAVCSPEGDSLYPEDVE